MTTAARPPKSEEVQRLVELFAAERDHYQKDLGAAAAMVSEQKGESEKNYNAAELAAWTVVSNVLLNLDETLNK